MKPKTVVAQAESSMLGLQARRFRIATLLWLCYHISLKLQGFVLSHFRESCDCVCRFSLRVFSRNRNILGFKAEAALLISGPLLPCSGQEASRPICCAPGGSDDTRAGPGKVALTRLVCGSTGYGLGVCRSS